MMRYVQRDSQGNIVGDYANPQPGFAEEPIADDHPDIIARRPVPLDLSNIDNLDRILKALGMCVAQLGGLTVQQMKALFKSKFDSLP